MKRALILAGGLGTRLHPFTKVVPKPLLPIGDQTLLERHVAQLAASGYTRIFIAIHYLADLVRGVIESFASRYEMTVKVLHETEPLGTFGSVLSLARLLAREDTDDAPFLVLNADIVSDIDLTEFHRFACVQWTRMVVAVNDYLCNIPYGVVQTEDAMVVGITEKPELRLPILAGLYCVRPSIVDCCPFREGEPVGADRVIASLLERGESIGVFRHSGLWVDTGTFDDLVRAHQLLESSVR
jgi:mannose-1-phosphate guanylyltransferase